MDNATILRRIRWALGIFIVGLVISGVTAFPLLREMEWLTSLLGAGPEAKPTDAHGLLFWLLTVREALRHTYADYPFLAYGTDWLAFGHLVIAIFFIGPWRDPKRNIWVLQAGMIACVAVIPLALICGQIRGIPLGWRVIDCSFGVIGILPLIYAYRLTAKLAVPTSGHI